MKEFIPVGIAMLLCTMFYSLVIYDTIEYKGGGSVHECFGECYDTYKERQKIQKQEAKELMAFNEENGIVVQLPNPGEKIWAGCTGCHGQNGEGGIGPMLSGQSYDYIFGRLTTYKDRGTVGKQSNMMWSQASAMSDQQILDVSSYISEEL